MGDELADAPRARLTWPGSTPKKRLLALLPELPGPVVFTSNEIGGGLIAMSREVRQFVDELGLLHQGIQARCQHLHWVVAGAVFLADATRWGRAASRRFDGLAMGMTQGRRSCKTRDEAGRDW